MQGVFFQKNRNPVSTLLYHIVCGTKYRHPVLTGAVYVETKTILAQTCTEYGWSLKAIEVMSTSFSRSLPMMRPLQ